MLATTNIDSVKKAIGHDILQTLQEQFLISAVHSFTGSDDVTVKRSWKRAEDTMAEISKRFIATAIKNGKSFEPEVIRLTIQKVIDEQRKIAIGMVADLVGTEKI